MLNRLAAGLGCCEGKTIRKALGKAEQPAPAAGVERGGGMPCRTATLRFGRVPVRSGGRTFDEPAAGLRRRMETGCSWPTHRGRFTLAPSAARTAEK